MALTDSNPSALDRIQSAFFKAQNKIKELTDTVAELQAKLDATTAADKFSALQEKFNQIQAILDAKTADELAAAKALDQLASQLESAIPEAPKEVEPQELPIPAEVVAAPEAAPPEPEAAPPEPEAAPPEPVEAPVEAPAPA